MKSDPVLTSAPNRFTHYSLLSALKKGQIHRRGRGERGDFLEKTRPFSSFFPLPSAFFQ